MKFLHTLIIAAAVAVISTGIHAADAEDHSQHHPESSSAKAVAKPASPKSKEQAMKMDEHMSAMRNMHEKMMNTKTPEERKALMAEHMKTMQKGMSMMNSMMGGEAAGKKTSREMMQKQMDMMQMMTEMMKDRMGEQAPDK